MDKPKYWPRIADPQAAVELLQRESVWHIGGYDGCLCTWFKIMNFEVGIGCRKGSGEGKNKITVSCSSLGTDAAELQLVAEEVARQVREQEPHIPVVIAHKFA